MKETDPMMDFNRFVSFGEELPAPTKDLTRLHAVLLPTSPVSLLGRRFMEHFYYSILPREGLIFGAVAYVGEQPAGFVVATHDPNRFMQSALRRFWPYLLWVIGISLLSAPRSIKSLYTVWQVMRSRSSPIEKEGEGEILSLGVLSEYRTPQFIRQSGLRLSNDLLECAVAQLCKKDIRVIRATVSAENTPAKLFYSGLGWKLDRASGQSWRHQVFEFVWRA